MSWKTNNTKRSIKLKFDLLNKRKRSSTHNKEKGTNKQYQEQKGEQNYFALEGRLNRS